MTEPEEVPIPERLPHLARWQRADFRTERGPQARYVTMAMRNGHTVVYVWTARAPGTWPELAFELSAEGLFGDSESAEALAGATATEAASFVTDEFGVPRTWADAMAARVCSCWRPVAVAERPAREDLGLRESA